MLTSERELACEQRKQNQIALRQKILSLLLGFQNVEIRICPVGDQAVHIV
jgi:hypothetical protein